MKKKFNPTTHIFLWDLHEVVLEKKLSNWFMLCIRFKRKWQIIKHLDQRTITILFTFIGEYLGFTKKQMVFQELLNAAQKANNTALIDLVLDICSSYVPIHSTVMIIEKLSQQGYKHYICSNIGKVIFERCVQKFPHLFSFFDGYIIPFQSSKNNKIIKKPHAEFFLAFLNTYHFEPEQIIFIDDKLPNIEAARALGMHGIQCKSPQDLILTLEELHILSH